MTKRLLSTFVLFFVAIFAVGCTKETEQTQNQNTNATIVSAQNENVNANTNGSANPLCDWVDKSDVIIKVKFADGVEKDSSYEAGFYLSPINSTMRIARSGCDYRTGFSYDELKNLGAVQVGVRGYSDNNRRQIEGEPISVILDAEGKPDIGSNIEVTIID